MTDPVNSTISSSDSSPSTNVPSAASSSSRTQFSFQRFYSALDVAAKDPQNIAGNTYIDIADEIAALLASCGRVLQIAETDVREKSLQVRKALAKTKCSTIPSLVTEEVEKRVATKGSSGTTAVVRLLWMLDYVEVLLETLHARPSCSLREAINHSYDVVLAPRHNSWVIKQAVRVGSFTVPRRDKFIQTIYFADGSSKHLGSVDQVAEAVIQRVKVTRQALWALLESHNLSAL